MNPAKKQQFVSESLIPSTNTADTKAMAIGDPGMPEEFKWGSSTFKIKAVISSWKETGPCSHGSGEMYIKKHWYQVETDNYGLAKIYFERQARGRNRKARWWLYSLEKAP